MTPPRRPGSVIASGRATLTERGAGPVRATAFSPACVRSVRRGSRLDEGNQRRCLRAVALVLAGEGFAHEIFLGAQLAHERRHDDGEPDRGAHGAGGDGGAEQCGDQPRVDRMAHVGVRTRADQLVALLDGHRTAPVAAEMHPCPDREGETGDDQRHPDPAGEERGGPQSPYQGAPATRRPGEEGGTDREWQQVREARGEWLATPRRLAAQRREHPVETPAAPQPEDESHAGEHGVSYSKSRSRYHSIASTRAGRRSAAPPGKLACGMRANTSKRSAVPRMASATSLPAIPVSAMPWPEKPCRKYTLGASRPKWGARLSVMSTCPPQA